MPPPAGLATPRRLRSLKATVNQLAQQVQRMALHGAEQRRVIDALRAALADSDCWQDGAVFGGLWRTEFQAMGQPRSAFHARIRMKMKRRDLDPPSPPRLAAEVAPPVRRPQRLRRPPLRCGPSGAGSALGRRFRTSAAGDGLRRDGGQQHGEPRARRHLQPHHRRHHRSDRSRSRRVPDAMAPRWQQHLAASQRGIEQALSGHQHAGVSGRRQPTRLRSGVWGT